MPTDAVAPVENVLDAAERGATIVTANTRSARAIVQADDERQSARGLAAWRSPDVVSWGGLLLRLWNEALYGGLTGGITLLNTAQERRLWEEVVEADAKELLNPVATAENAQAAWELAKEYGVPISGTAYEGNPETEAFAKWAAEFEKSCRAKGWLSPVLLPDVLARHVRDGHLSVRNIMLVGFDEFTLQQKAFIDAAVEAGASCEIVELVQRVECANAYKVAAADQDAEIRAAAIWARERLTEGAPSPAGKGAAPRVAVVVPSLQNLRAHVESLFLAMLHPEQVPAGSSIQQRAFEISLGSPLSESPVIAAGLLILKLCLETVSLAEAGAILRSPFIAGGDSEMTARAQLDVLLRKNRVLETDARRLLDRARRNCPVLVECLGRVMDVDSVSSRSPRDWAALATVTLQSIGWPKGDRSLSSDEYQAAESWTAMLSEFGSLEAIEPVMDARRFLAALNEMASRRLFEPEKTGAPVQIMGLLEAAGSSFDHMWVMGLHDGAWPMRSVPTPFIPAALQMKYGLPHCSPQRELEFAERVHNRLLRSASDLVLSWPEKDGDAELRPSPLLDGLGERELREIVDEQADTWGKQLMASCKSEILTDETGPVITEGTLVKGGTRILERQSACPFRAFAELRLGAMEMDSPQPGLDGLQRGNIVHNAMEFVWKHLKTHDALMACEKLRELVSQAVDQAIEEARAGGTAEWERTLAEIERRRVTELILKFLEIEKTRAPFTVTAEEQKRIVTLGGLKMDMRMDRVDCLQDGRQVLIDYKTGEVSAKSWEDERPEAPQMPAYAATMEGEVAAVAFAQIKTGSVRYCGYSPDAQVMNAGDYAKTAPGAQGKQLTDAIAAWRNVVERLASEHREGRAEVDPAKPKSTCSYCPLPALCRYTELQAEDAGDEE